MTVAPGETIRGLAGEYRCLGKLGEGGFAVAYTAERVSDAAPVVLKELRIERLREWKALELFEREAAALRALSHPRIPKYYDFFAWDGAHATPAATLETAKGEDEETPSLVLVQQKLEGRTLAELVEAGTRLTTAEVERLLRGLLDIVRYLHDVHPPVIHRDINPNNVLLGDDGSPYLVDFGGVQDRLRISSLGSTQIGTVGYMPIEQLGGAARPATDLYAIGMTMLAVVSHAMPHEMPIDDRTSKVKVAEVAPHLDRRLRDVLDAMVEPIAARRPASATEVLRRLDRKPGSEARFLTIGVVGLGIALASVAFLARRSEPESAPPPASARAPDPTSAPAPSPPARKSAGVFQSAEEVGFVLRRTTAKWAARVRSSERIGLAQSSACTVTAEVETHFVETRPTEDRARVVTLDVECSGKTVYRFVATEKSNPWAAFSVNEYPGDERGTYRHTVHFYDHEGDAKLDIDTDERSASVIQGGAKPSRLELVVERLSAPIKVALYASTAKRTMSARPSRQWVSQVRAASGRAPAATGARCNVGVFPDWDSEGPRCLIDVDCNDAPVYIDRGRCPAEGPLKMEELELSKEDSSPQITLDADARTVTLKDRGEKGSWSLELQ